MKNALKKIKTLILFFIISFSITQTFSADQTYTINFKNVAVTEFINFVSKTCKTNFLYEEGDLGFNVTVVSEDEIKPENVMATLIQILRIHGLTLLEEGSNLVIHKNPDVKSLTKIFTEISSLDNAPPIITKVFQIKNAKIDSIATVIKPMISTEAMLEVLPETKHLIVTDLVSNIQKIGDLIEIIDSSQTPLDVEIYNTKANSPEYLMNLTNQIMAPLSVGTPFILVPQDLSGALFIVSTPKLIEKALSVLSTLDNPPKPGVKSGNVFIYVPKYLSQEEIQIALQEVIDSLKNSGHNVENLMNIINSAKWIDETHSFLFAGTDEGINKLKELLDKIDTLTISDQLSFFTYKPEHRKLSEIAEALKELEENLRNSKIADKKLLQTLKSVKKIDSTQSLLFTGDADTLSKIKELLSFVDLSKPTGQFFVYKPKNKPLNDLAESLKEISKNLEAANLVNPAFMQAIDSMKVVESTNSLLFTGDSESVKRIDDLLKTIDSPLEAVTFQKNIFIYRPQYTLKEEMENYLATIASHLDISSALNKNLKAAIDSAKWIPESNSFMFNGTDDALLRLKEILVKFDTKEEAEKLKDSYHLYKLQNTSGNIVVEDLDNFAENLKSQKIKKPRLIQILESAKWVKETNSILLTGNSLDLPEALEIVKQFDTRRTTQEVTAHSSYFLYKPKHAPSSFIEQSLKDTASNLEKAKLADPNLINAINSVRFVESTNSLAFTGTPESLEKIKIMISEIDQPGVGKTKIGKTTFFVYKIQKAAPQKLINSILSFAQDLEKSDTMDKDFIKALQSVKYKPEIHSLLFTGPTEAIEKVQPLVSRLDSDELSTTSIAPSAYFVYKPKYLTGPNLQEVLLNFSSHLKLTGFDNQNLYNSINNMKWDAQTKSLLFSGDDPTINEIKNLLTTFDIPGEGPEKEIIQPIEDTSFLVYKLQYHKGDSIQTALRQIANELTTSGTNVKKTLLSAINSIQWIQVTNSLLCSGDKETMTRLKELINSLDVPLKQVFIEMLVIVTSFTNQLNFGLDWGGKYKHKDKFVAGIGNNPPTSTDPTANTFHNNLSALNETNKVSGSSFPFAPGGFDLGIIGDLILHKGKSFLSLGSLVEAIQSDNESSIIMTPKILAQDSKPSYLFIGQNVPYTGSSTVFTSTTQTSTANLEYRDIGMEITITPVLGNSDIVSLDINMSRSIESPDSANSSPQVLGVQGITTDKTTLTTTVHIPNKCFLALSGMGTNNKTKLKTGIPCLGGLPLVGAAFSQNNKLDDKKNIVIFIRPHIINSYKDMESITENSEDFYRDNSGAVSLEADYDEGIDFIKSYDDEE